MDCWRSRYNDEEFEAMRREYVVAAGGNPDSPFVPVSFYIDTSDDPRWYTDDYVHGKDPSDD